MLAIAMAVFTLSACEDVPAPYEKPNNDGGETVETGSGTAEDPYTVAGAKVATTTTGQYVKGYIVGYVYGKALSSGAVFAAEDTCTVATNVLIAASPDETTVGNCMPVQLPSGAVRTGVNLKDNKANLKQEVLLYGNITSYFGSTGLKEVTYAKVGTTEFGSKPGGEDTPSDPSGEQTGAGTLESPYNVAKASAIIAAGTYTSDKVYISGTISQVESVSTSYGNANYYISDDGTTTGQLEVFRGYYLNGEKFTAEDQIKVGDKVIICGVLTLYNSKAEVTTGSTIYSLNGSTGDKKGEDTPSTGSNLISNGDFESWTSGAPDNWKSASTASNATLTQSNDAHGGSYSVSVGYSTTNKRIGYKEMTLKAGTYKFSFYAKSTTADKSQCRPGYAIVVNGSIDSSTGYKYGSYQSLVNTEWTLVTNEFTLTEATTVCLIVMNPKTSSYATAQNILIDDATLMTSDGGISE